MKNGEYILVVAPKNYDGKKYRNKYCYEHILVYWEYYKILPKDNEIIHHIDGNKHNNDISNLKLMSKLEHDILHKNKRGIKFVMLKCTGCGKIFEKEKRKTFLISGGKFTCCCRKCIGITTGLNQEEKNKRISQNLIYEFTKYK